MGTNINALYKHLPSDMKNLKLWTTHGPDTKRPHIPPGHDSEALELSDALLKGLPLGMLLSKSSTVACIDIDCPREVKQEEVEAAQRVIASINGSNDRDNDSGNGDSGEGSKEYEEYILSRPWLIAALQSAPILQLLLKQTYTELSPSKVGFHIWLHVPDKNGVHVYKSCAHGLDGQISLSNSFMTCTGKKLYSAPSSLAPLPLAALTGVFVPHAQVQASAQQKPEQEQASNAQQKPVHGWDDIHQLMRMLPPSLLGNSAQQELYRRLTQQTYEHYNYWVMVGMALHDYDTGPQAYALYLEWSKRDIDGFKSEQDVYDKWQSFNEPSADKGRARLTVATLVALANRLSLQYPRRVVKQGKETRAPRINEYANFQYLLDHYNIKLHKSNMGYYVSGENDILQRYFKFPEARVILNKFHGPLNINALVAATIELCQSHWWENLVTTQQHVKNWIERAPIFDLFTEWLDTPYEELPDSIRLIDGVEASEYNHQSTLRYVLDCMDIQVNSDTREWQEQERNMYEACFEKTLYHILKYREPSIANLYTQDSGGMLILVGPEHTYKTTFCHMLFPAGLTRLLRSTLTLQADGAKGQRDFARSLATTAMLQVDEFEGLMDMRKSSSFFKSLLSSDEITYTEIYSSAQTTLLRKAVIIATTNELRHILSSEGSRRLWFVPTGILNTSAMRFFNHHYFYNSLRDKLRAAIAQKKFIWRLTKEQSEIRTLLNAPLGAASNNQLALKDIFDFNTPMPADYIPEDVDLKVPQPHYRMRLMKPTHVFSILKEYGHSGQMSLSALNNELRRLCSDWTGTTQRITKNIKGSTKRIVEGRAVQAYNAKRGDYAYAWFVMPPLHAHIQRGHISDARDSPEEQ